ncbi:MAG: hypothetical protein LC744_03095 [Chloroflexi bacterium]|nr:hypothetical protein [Chloroflexota bacterium]
MNMRALGCGLIAAAGFVLIGVIAIWRAGAPAECPGLLPYEPAAYEPVGTPMPEPALEGVDGPLERAPQPVSFGLASWPVFLPPGTAPTASGVPLPPRIVLDCRDGTFQAFRRGTQ